MIAHPGTTTITKFWSPRLCSRGRAVILWTVRPVVGTNRRSPRRRRRRRRRRSHNSGMEPEEKRGQHPKGHDTQDEPKFPKPPRASLSTGTGSPGLLHCRILLFSSDPLVRFFFFFFFFDSNQSIATVLVGCKNGSPNHALNLNLSLSFSMRFCYLRQYES